MKFRKGYALIIAALMLLLCTGNTRAASLGDALINGEATGSLTIVKYDEAVRQNVTAFDSYVATGIGDAALEQAGAAYGLPGIVFSCLRVGEVESFTENLGGTILVRNLYGLSPEIRELLSLSAAEGTKAVGSETVYFTPERLNEALRMGGSYARSSALALLAAEKGTALPATDGSGRTTLSGLPLGLYLVAETAVTEKVDSTVEPFFVSLPMGSARDAWNYQVTVYPKNATSEPRLTKEVAEVTSAGIGGYGRYATASAGDTLSYRIGTELQSISTVQTYYTELKWTDVLSKGLSYKRGDAVLSLYENGSMTEPLFSLKKADNCFTVSYGKKKNGSETMTLELNAEGLGRVNKPEYSGYVIGITYGVKMKSSSALTVGTAGNPNEVEFNWIRGGNTAAEGSLFADCRAYSFGLDLTKEFSDQNGDASAVLFKLQNSTDKYYVTASGSDGVYYVTGSSAADCDEAALSPDAAGHLKVYGLEDDRYTLTELKTAPGYNLLRDAVVLDIVATENTDSATGEGNGEITVTAAVNGEAVSMEAAGGSGSALLPLTIINQKGFDLPATGDTGRLLLPLSGFLGAVLLLSFSFMRRKRRSA